MSINEAMILRNGKDPRAGDLWCHENCYNGKSGSRLLTKQASIDERTSIIKKKSHYSKWPNQYYANGNYCAIEQIAISKRESMDYGNYFCELQAYLSSLKGKSHPYFIVNVVQNSSEFKPDFEITHSVPISGNITKTEIHIIDDNQKRLKKYQKSRIKSNTFVLVMRISEYTIEQLNDFEIGGINKFNAEWNYLLKIIGTLEDRTPTEFEKKSVINGLDSYCYDYQIILSKVNKISKTNYNIKANHLINDRKYLMDVLLNKQKNGHLGGKYMCLSMFTKIVEMYEGIILNEEISHSGGKNCSLNIQLDYNNNVFQLLSKKTIEDKGDYLFNSLSLTNPFRPGKDNLELIKLLFFNLSKLCLIDELTSDKANQQNLKSVLEEKKVMFEQLKTPRNALEMYNTVHAVETGSLQKLRDEIYDLKSRLRFDEVKYRISKWLPKDFENYVSIMKLKEDLSLV